jgi:hypothetical protein
VNPAGSGATRGELREREPETVRGVEGPEQGRRGLRLIQVRREVGVDEPVQLDGVEPAASGSRIRGGRGHVPGGEEQNLAMGSSGRTG